MDLIFFNCPRCNSELEISEEYIGVEIKCPYCEQTFAISAPWETPGEESAENSSERKKEKKNGTGSFSGEKKFALLNGIIALTGLVIAVGTFLLLFFFKDYEHTYYFKKDAEDAVKEYWRVKLNDFSKSNYDIRKNKKELLDSLKITDTEEKRDFAVVFYRFKFNGDTFNDSMVFELNDDDYFVVSSIYTLRKKYPEWYDEIKKKTDAHAEVGDKSSINALFD